VDGEGFYWILSEMNLLQDIYMYRMGGWEVIYDWSESRQSLKVRAGFYKSEKVSLPSMEVDSF
jgi:hypothetical protein